MEPIYRYYKKISDKSSDHKLTVRQVELEKGKDGYKLQGMLGKVFTYQAPETVPLYRLYKSKGMNHFYTVDEAEREKTLKKDTQWEDQGIIGYIYNDAGEDRKPLHRFHSGIYDDTYYTTDEKELQKVKGKSNWRYQGIHGYLK